MTTTSTRFDTDRATALVDRLRVTFRAGVTKPPAWRKQQLRLLRALLTDNRDAIAAALHTDLRKNRAEVDTSEIGSTVAEIDTYLEHLDAWTSPRPVAITAPGIPAGSVAHTRLEPQTPSASPSGTTQTGVGTDEPSFLKVVTRRYLPEARSVGVMGSTLGGDRRPGSSSTPLR